LTKTALVIGVTGQDGSYLTELLLNKGYRVWGVIRRSSSFNTSRIEQVINTPGANFDWLRGDLTDQLSIIRVLNSVKPDEIYNLGAQSHVKVSFEIPVYTFDVVATGTLRLLEAVKSLEIPVKLYQAGSSEMFGSAPPPQKESTPFDPRSPYAVAKTASHQLCVDYRESYGMWIANGILFNHESPRRGETFVTRKITRAVARMALGVQNVLHLGNVDAERDWGYAPEYVAAMWRMLQERSPDDFVIATGVAHSVSEFAEEAFRNIGLELRWVGRGQARHGVVEKVEKGEYSEVMKVSRGDTVVRISEANLRPADPECLRGDSSKAKAKIGWSPKTSFRELVKIMVDSDLRSARILLEGTRKHNEEWREYLV
jgi:GDPmannose 4,6-dehydratase